MGLQRHGPHLTGDPADRVDVYKRQVFYNHDGSVRGYTAADVQSYESPEELRGTIEDMLTAFDHPVLTRTQLDAINRPKTSTP